MTRSGKRRLRLNGRSSAARHTRRKRCRTRIDRRRTMSTIEALLQELEQETQTTKRVLARVPNDHLAWKPHEKSMSMGQLALHVATVPGAIAEISRQSPFKVGQFTQPPAASAEE